MLAPVSFNQLNSKETICQSRVRALNLREDNQINPTEINKMTSQTKIEFPYLFTGIPPVIEEWLRLSGLPIAPFRMTNLLSEEGPMDKQKIVFFDSRNHLSRAEAQLAEQIGYLTVNVASLIFDREAESWSEYENKSEVITPDQLKRDTARFLLRLKRKVESLGGLWVRIADFPYPYQSVAVVESEEFLPNRNLPAILEQFEKQSSDLSVDSGLEFSDWYSSKYQNRLPVLLTSSEAEHSTKFLRENYPLTWITSVENFMSWWEYRQQIQLRIEMENDQYHVFTDRIKTTEEDFLPSVEIWRDEHVATFELISGGMKVRDNQLAFVNYGSSKSPAGFAPVNMTRSSHWKMIENDSAQTA